MNLAEFHFLRPEWFLALLPAALLLVLLIKHRQSRGSWTEVCDAELLPFILDDKPVEKRSGGLIAGALACLLTIIALAGPTWERLPSPAFRNDAALVIALDLSVSMDAADIKPSRLVKARYKIADLLKQRKDGQTALLVYGGDAFTVTPLTGDTATIASQLEALNTDIMPSPGTNTGVAIQKAVDLLRQAGLAKGHILLVTDGVDADSAALADSWLGDYRLSVLAVGTPEGAPIQKTGGFVKDVKGNIVVAGLDAEALAELARKGRGVYQPVTAGDDDVDTLGRVFNAASADGENRDGNLLLQQWDEKGPWLLLPVLPWAALRFRKGLLLFGLLCLLPLPRDSQALDWQSLWQTPNQQARQAFDQQQYQQAAEQFDSPDWRAAAQYKAGQYQEAAETLKDTQTADSHYNRGNALAQTGQLQEALQAYQQALKLEPGHQDAQYNKELVEKKLKENQQQQDKDQNQQQDQKQSPEQQKDQGQQKQNQDSQSGQSEADKQNQQQPDGNDQSQAKPDAKQQAGDKEKNESKAGDKQQADEGQQPKPEPADDAQTSRQQAANIVEKQEAERANEQLLKRIPDEPTGLLKRKFKYQYGQRAPPSQNGPDW
ncbi:MAG: VWA domain-containing protein [Methylococcaceae bacterium]|nr:VWA domain-containing protein [Methylococcaceae bacterium]